MKEANIMRQVQIDVSKAGSRVFRNNVGKSWIGKSDGPVGKPTTVTLMPGDVVVRQARRFHAGLHDGSSDLIGWTPVVITEAHVGRKMALFTSLEVKKPRGRGANDDQVNWIEQVNKAGGIAGEVRSSADALDLIRGFCGG